MPVIPVYYGDSQVPNITVTPSFIRVADYESPDALAAYLLFLDTHPDEYAKYHTWRKNPASISKDYLKSVEENVPGPKELLHHIDDSHRVYYSSRRAVCCRLCNEAFVKCKVKERKQKLARREPILVEAPWSHTRIEEKFYGGKD